IPGAVARAEVLRVLRPGGKALLGGEVLTKPVPEGIDDWTHPYHGPDNNPQSTDQLARAPYLTQFLATPLWGCQPQVTVMAGGRAFRAFGHMAFRAYQNAAINTLYAMSSYNGAILWKRKLEPGFMIHRNAMIATPEVLYLADDESCKLIDAATGELKGRIAPPPETAGGTVWKWMALEGGVLYALLGAGEVTADVRPGQGARISGWPWSMWKGYDYKDPNTAWGFGRALLAIDPRSKKVLWSYRAEEVVDSRGVCMHSGRIFFYSRGKSLGCLNASDGRVRWQTSDAKLLEAIGPDTRAQTAKFGFTTSVYAKCTADVLLFAGPQRPNLVAVSARDGKLLWQKKDGNFQLVLRPDALYAMGAGKSLKLDYRTGEVLGEIHGRQACTRATGSVDSIFVRGRGTRRVEVPSANRSEHITPMRPSCHDGVIVSNGLLHWSPWICGCSLCLFGNVCLGPAGDFDPQRAVDESAQHEPGEGDWQRVKAPPAEGNDWPAYLANSRR
ncbi:MAG: PQQ-binding-like beta-propeller repeat protein, partial [Phycisphaerae bacterium]